VPPTLLDGDFDETTLVNRITRLKYPMGAPLLGYVAADEKEDEQRAKIGEGWLDGVVGLGWAAVYKLVHESSLPPQATPSYHKLEVAWFSTLEPVA
jgi:hypothetical protein